MACSFFYGRQILFRLQHWLDTLFIERKKQDHRQNMGASLLYGIDVGFVGDNLFAVQMNGNPDMRLIMINGMIGKWPQ